MRLSVDRQKEYRILTLSGRIEWADARKLDRTIRRLVDEGSYHIVFELSDVSFICSAGIGALVYNLNAVKKHGGAIYIVSSNDYIEYMFETLKFDMIFDGFIFPSLDDFRRSVIEHPDNA
jgi:anti-anti-sigma factor